MSVVVQPPTVNCLLVFTNRRSADMNLICKVAVQGSLTRYTLLKVSLRTVAVHNYILPIILFLFIYKQSRNNTQRIKRGGESR